MTYIRKTRDEWQLWIDYGQGFEHELTEDSYREIRQRAREYRDNCPQYPRSIRRRRVPHACDPVIEDIREGRSIFVAFV